MTMISREQLENRLRAVMIPVEPDDTFVRKLKGQLVEVRGISIWTPWSAILLMVLVLLLLLSWMGLVMRLVFTILGLLGLFRRWLPNQKQASPSRS